MTKTINLKPKSEKANYNDVKKVAELVYQYTLGKPFTGKEFAKWVNLPTLGDAQKLLIKLDVYCFLTIVKPAFRGAAPTFKIKSKDARIVAIKERMREKEEIRDGLDEYVNSLFNILVNEYQSDLHD